MAWFRVHLSADERQIVHEDRVLHPHPRVREKMLVLWLLHCGLTREKAAEIVGVARVTVQRYVEAFRDGGLEGLRRWGVCGPVSELAAFRDVIRESLEKQPVATIAEACVRVLGIEGVDQKRPPPLDGPHHKARVKPRRFAHLTWYPVRLHRGFPR